MRKKERYEKVIAWFQENVPVAETELHYNNPYELLIAVILSAQCTDKRVNMITPTLYKDFPTPEALAATTPEVVFEYIRSVSYPNNKAKHLVGMAKMLVNDFQSQVPDNLEDLTKLPGVGRKTANVIQSVVFNKAAMAVDTHVFRVSHRLGAGRCSDAGGFSHRYRAAGRAVHHGGCGGRCGEKADIPPSSCFWSRAGGKPRVGAGKLGCAETAGKGTEVHCRGQGQRGPESAGPVEGRKNTEKSRRRRI